MFAAAPAQEKRATEGSALKIRSIFEHPSRPH
jgi:hypothetical protein